MPPQCLHSDDNANNNFYQITTAYNYRKKRTHYSLFLSPEWQSELLELKLLEKELSGIEMQSAIYSWVANKTQTSYKQMGGIVIILEQ